MRDLTITMSSADWGAIKNLLGWYLEEHRGDSRRPVPQGFKLYELITEAHESDNRS